MLAKPCDKNNNQWYSFPARAVPLNVFGERHAWRFWDFKQTQRDSRSLWAALVWGVCVCEAVRAGLWHIHLCLHLASPNNIQCTSEQNNDATLAVDQNLAPAVDKGWRLHVFLFFPLRLGGFGFAVVGIVAGFTFPNPAHTHTHTHMDAFEKDF